MSLLRLWLSFDPDALTRLLTCAPLLEMGHGQPPTGRPRLPLLDRLLLDPLVRHLGDLVERSLHVPVAAGQPESSLDHILHILDEAGHSELGVSHEPCIADVEEVLGPCRVVSLVTTPSAPSSTEGTALPASSSLNLCPAGDVKLVMNLNVSFTLAVFLFITMYAAATQPGSILASVFVGKGTTSYLRELFCL